jgi:hypothetical protein
MREARALTRSSSRRLPPCRPAETMAFAGVTRAMRSHDATTATSSKSSSSVGPVRRAHSLSVQSAAARPRTISR